ncbi:YhfT family protein [Enterococcus sp. BWB1-3]|uniref:YhfT family protein n=1 Tax=Enterococcus sp. BWB1-3 TaxID=2787713 RepID=UPI0019216360|nr:YhfT family protein [Enterococcus sp. BWB1-3]MBL1227941.1 YhfT family protein [Enterococcus sp. BWB1-3]
MDGSKVMELIVIALLGGMCSILTNRGIAVFNDGLRPIVPEFLEGKIGKKEIAATSFALSFGLVIGFGIPVSIGASIILVHSILLATDIIGSWSPEGVKGMIISGTVGAAYGVGIVLGLQAVVDLFAKLPINFLDSLSMVGSPVVIAFSIFPAVAIAHQHNFKKGAIALLATMLTLFTVKKFGTFNIGNGTSFTLSAEGMSLLVGMIFMIVFAIQVKGDGNSSNQSLMSIFLERVERIKKNWILLSLTGGLVSAATSLLMIAGDPISLNLLSEGKFSEAALAAFARGIGFIPLVFSTAIVTGVYSPAGTTFVFVVGILLRGNPIVAFAAGAAVMFVEIMLLNGMAKGLDRFPGVREMGEYIRTSMNKVLEVALLIGGAMASESIAPGIGYFWVIGLSLLNKTAKKPVVDLAVGPVAAISLGIIVNILYLLGLFTPAG